MGRRKELSQNAMSLAMIIQCSWSEQSLDCEPFHAVALLYLIKKISRTDSKTD